MFIQRKGMRNGARRRIMAETDVAPEAAELLFEAEDVAELVAEVTGETVEVSADDTTVTFDVGEESFTVEADGNEETVESAIRIARGRKPVSASTRRGAMAGRRSRTVRKMPRRK